MLNHLNQKKLYGWKITKFIVEMNCGLNSYIILENNDNLQLGENNEIFNIYILRFFCSVMY